VTIQGPVEFDMGSPDGEPAREPDEALHRLRIDRSFAVGVAEVTISQFRSFRSAKENDRYSPTPDCPVNGVTWFDAIAYCRWLCEQEGMADEQMCFPSVDKIGPGMSLPDNLLARTGYRLPTEAEWEFCCRAGTSTARPWGKAEALIPSHAVCVPGSQYRTWPVALRKPNALGFFDMLGNVSEMCLDVARPYVADDDPHRVTLDAPQFTSAGESDKLRRLRGGDFERMPDQIRTARRDSVPIDQDWAIVGFRVARTMPKTP
jgi:formylglycine-generating enzyme required for sulfatase activity